MLKVMSLLFLLAGSFFLISAILGLFRLPDVYNRGHAVGKADTVGILFCAAGAWCYWVTINPMESVKLIIVGVFWLITSPTATHAILRSAFKSGVKPCSTTKKKDIKK